MMDTIFALIFPAGASVGLEIILKKDKKQWICGECHSERAKLFVSVLKDARVLSINWKSTSSCSSIEDIQRLFKTFEKMEKRIIFSAKLTVKMIEEMIVYDKYFEVLDFDEEVDLKPDQTLSELHNRPLGFTIASSPTGGVEVVQVDSIHEEDIKLGSKLIAVNGRYIKNEKDVLETLLNCFMPVHLVLETVNDENIFAPEEKDDGGLSPTRLALCGNHENMIELNIQWFSDALGKEDFILLVKPDATVAVIRAKIAVTSQLKFNAVKLISKGVLLKDDNLKLCDMDFQDNDVIRVVVSQTTQEKPEEKAPVDYLIEMKIVGAFLKSCDSSLLNYLWDDIDYTKRDIVHKTELDRLLTRFLGLYERSISYRLPIRYEHGIITFNTNDMFGLVIEGNEVVMCNPKSQAEQRGIQPGWKVVGAEYNNNKGRRVKFTVDHKSCLESLKRAKRECAEDTFHVLCLIPKGQRYETMMVMKKHALLELDFSAVQIENALTKKQYVQLPDIYSQKAVRVSFKDGVDTSCFTASDTKGAVVSKDALDSQLKSYVGAQVLAINSTTVALMAFGDVMKALLAHKPPHYLTLDTAS